MRDEGDVVAEGERGGGGFGDAVEGYLSWVSICICGGVVEALAKSHYGGFTGARAANEADELAGADGEE
jgi:hypothetical protein